MQFIMNDGSNMCKGEEGYFTVEAAWIGSFSCVLFLFIMVVAVYFYDVGVVMASLQEDVAQMTLEEDATSSKEESKARQRVILTEIKEYSVTVKSNKITGTATLSVGFPIPILQDWLGKSWENQIQVQMEQADAPDYIRKCRLLP